MDLNIATYIKYLYEKDYVKLRQMPNLTSDQIATIEGDNIRMHFYCWYGCEELNTYEKHLLERKYNIENDNLYTVAVSNGQISVMKNLEKLGFDNKIKTVKGMNMVLVAISNGQLEAMKYLTDSNSVDIFEIDNENNNAYLLACEKGYMEIIEYLENLVDRRRVWKIIKYAKNTYGYNAYLLACANAKMDVVKHLENSDIDKTLTVQYGYNAYLLACANGHVDLMEHLENIGFDTKSKDSDGNSAYMVACINNQLPAMKHLERKFIHECKSEHAAYFTASYLCNLEIIQHLEDIGFDIHITNQYHDNVYLMASQYGRLEAIKYFEKKGFDVNYVNQDGYNAYLVACYHNQFEVVKYLEAGGINIHHIEENGYNAYLVASLEGHIEIMEYLEIKGFDINVKDKIGRNAYFLACTNGNFELMKYFDKKGLNIYEKDYDGNTAMEVAKDLGLWQVMTYLTNIRYKKYFYDNVENCECRICYNAKDEQFIKCKNNHIVHVGCHHIREKVFCVSCFDKFVPIEDEEYSSVIKCKPVAFSKHAFFNGYY